MARSPPKREAASFYPYLCVHNRQSSHSNRQPAAWGNAGRRFALEGELTIVAGRLCESGELTVVVTVRIARLLKRN
jgi:hypothetical protein